MSAIPSMVDRPFGCPPDNPSCSCANPLGRKWTINDQRLCRTCFQAVMGRTKGGRPSKYGAVRTDVDGITFASKGEARRYEELKLLNQAGYIRLLELQPTYPIYINGKHICNVVLDFRYFEGQTRQVEDFKGKDNPLSRLKRKLVEAAYPGTKVKVTR